MLIFYITLFLLIALRMCTMYVNQNDFDTSARESVTIQKTVLCAT